jgi:hypothetical protein
MTNYALHLDRAKVTADAAADRFRASNGADDERDALIMALTELVYVTSLIGDDDEDADTRSWLVMYAVAITRGCPLMCAADLIDTAAEVYHN